MDKIDTETVMQLIARIKPFLAGQHPAVQGAALAELLAIWLRGHQVDEATRECLLTMHIDTVRQLATL